MRRTDSREIGGRVIQLPMVDVHTVGAGGGSIGWRDAGGALRVGPRSAGAEPGPACYGRGGDRADGDRRQPAARLPRRRLARSPAASSSTPRPPSRAVARLGRARSGSSELETAEGIVRVANQEMVRALRVVTVERGVDPREFALMPFGGAGPMHAAAIADELGIERILCPRASGVLSALGLLASERRRDTARTVMLQRRRADRRADRRRGRGAARRDSRAGLEDAEPRSSTSCATAARPSSSPVAGHARPDPAELAERFAAEHERALRLPRPRGARSSWSTIRARAGRAGPGAAAARRRRRRGSSADGRRARFGGEWLEAEVLRGEPAAGTDGRGPVRVRAARGDAGAAARAGRREVDEAGTIVAERQRRAASDSTRSRSRSSSAACARPATRWARC